MHPFSTDLMSAMESASNFKKVVYISFLSPLSLEFQKLHGGQSFYIRELVQKKWKKVAIKGKGVSPAIKLFSAKNTALSPF